MSSVVPRAGTIPPLVRWLLFYAAAAPAVLLGVGIFIVVDYLSWQYGIYLLPFQISQLIIPTGVLGLLAMIPAVHRVEHRLVTELLGIDIGAPSFAAAESSWFNRTLFALAHLIAAVGMVATPVFIFTFTLNWLAYMPTEVGWSVMYDFATSTLSRALGLIVILSIIAATVLLVIAMPHLARWLLGPSRAAELRLAREQTARLEARNAIARDIHDSVGHALTITTIQATAASRLVHRDPAQAAAMLETIAEVGRQAQAELDHSLRALRLGSAEDAAPALPVNQCSIEALPAVIDQVADAGFTVDARIDDLSVPADVGRELFQITREAATNAIRHASRPQWRYSLRRTDEHIELQAINPGTRRAARGTGLHGIDERCAGLGGTSVVETADGEFRLICRFPAPAGTAVR